MQAKACFSLGSHVAIILMVAVSTLAVAADELPTPLADGVHWLAVTITPEQRPKGYSHAGIDLFSANKKQVYLGKGWRGDNRGKWGIWSAIDKRSAFGPAVVVGSANTLVVKLDFGGTEVGDEAISLWLNPPTERRLAKPAVRLAGLTISTVDSFREFSDQFHQITPLRIAESYAGLSNEETKAEDPQLGERLFKDKIRPLLVEKCGGCHGDSAKKIKGDYDMRNREALLKGGESGIAAVDFDHLDDSPFLRAVRWQDEDLEMPPKANDRLSEREIGWLRQWLAAGAPWVADDATVAMDPDWAKPDADGARRVRTSGGQSPVWTNRRYAPEDLWAYQPVRQPAVPWDALPSKSPRHPIDAFVAQTLHKQKITPAAPAPMRQLLRRVSLSLTGLPPSAQALETVNNADSYKAYVDTLLASPHYGERQAQHWLDVVRYADSNGFSRDDFRPDAFRYRDYVIQAFNNDLPYDRFIGDQIAGDQLGTAGQDALSFLWMGPWEHTAMSVAAVTRQQWLDDVVNTVGITFLGHQMRCAKCHDHKFDPIPTRDYYGMQAIFAATRHNQKAGNFAIKAQKPQAIAILNGGALDSPTDPVSPAALSLLANTAGHPFPAKHPKGRRATLAKWIATGKNPLTARVMANRIWQHHFGHGLVATPNDFGKMGAKPTHPELLDWLANWFVESGWSTKALHRLIVTSTTYQRSAQAGPPEQSKDPNNQWLGRANARRLSAEEIRDAILTSSGQLNAKIGGPSNYPELNWEFAFQPRLAMGKLVPPYQPDPTPSQRNRRALYAVRIRNLGHPFMETFNRPGTELACDRRTETTVASQSLTLLHGEFANDQAIALADRIARQHQQAKAQITTAFQEVYRRAPDANEIQACLAHLDSQTKHHTASKPVRRQIPTSIQQQNVKEKTGAAETVTFKLDKLVNYQNDLEAAEVPPATRALADLCLALFNSSEFLYVY